MVLDPFREIEATDSKKFATVMHSFMRHTETILNYFKNRSTNAAAESFNAKIKGFRRQFRG
ncbi:MAG: transposase, partial [Flavobacteriaceae bacterium]|nr:transposase [Flavobacteriaceae bacterium]